MTSDKPLQSSSPRNLLEWLAARGFPDSSLTLVIGLLAALSLAPYLGGTTVSFVGESAVAIPTISAASFWLLVFLTPILWCFVGVRLIGARPLLALATLGGAVLLSSICVVGHKLYPSIALSSITPSFEETYRLDFLTKQRTWTASHVRDSAGDRYCHFRTEAIDLGAHVHDGCALRIDRMEIQATGYAAVNESAGFDLEAYVSSSKLMPETSDCVSTADWQAVNTRPQDAEIMVRSVIEVPKVSLTANGDTHYGAKYDFSTKSASAQPALAFVKQFSRQDIHIRGAGAQLQLAGWTLWGDPSTFDMTAISVTLAGRLQCGFWFG